jgi:uncharacterized RDD family membrane protein YckC
VPQPPPAPTNPPPRIPLTQTEDRPVASTAKRFWAYLIDQMLAWTLVAVISASISAALVSYIHSKLTDPVFWTEILDKAFSSAWPKLLAGHAEKAGDALLNTATHELVVKILLPLLLGVAAIVLAITVIPFLYQFIGMALFGNTPGRLVLGIKVVRPPSPYALPEKRKKRIGTGRSLIRAAVGPPAIILGLLLVLPVMTGMATLGVTLIGVLVLLVGLGLLALGLTDAVFAMMSADGKQRSLHDRWAGTAVVDLERGEAVKAGAVKARDGAGRAKEVAAARVQQARDSQLGQTAAQRVQDVRNSAAAQHASEQLQKARESQIAQQAAARMREAGQSRLGQQAAARLQQARDSKAGQQAQQRSRELFDKARKFGKNEET